MVLQILEEEDAIPGRLLDLADRRSAALFERHQRLLHAGHGGEALTRVSHGVEERDRIFERELRPATDREVCCGQRIA